MYAYTEVYGAPSARILSQAIWSRSRREASRRCAARSARTIRLGSNVAVMLTLYLSLARPSRKLAGVRPTARAHPRGRGDQPGAVGGRGRRGPAAVPRHHGDDARDGARAGPVGRMFLRKLRLRLRRQGRNLRPGGGSAARPTAPHGGALPARAARHGRDVSALHPFSLLAIAAALPAFAWILPAPGGALATALVALGLTLTPGAGPGSTAGWSTPGRRPGFVTFRTALVSAAP